MKTIGLIGGLTCESTVPYYRVINRIVKERLGGQHSAELILYSVDFAAIDAAMNSGRWDDIGQMLGNAAEILEGAGADFLALCSNTVHKVAPIIEGRVGIPLLHIADATAQAVTKRSFRKVGLIGTRFTMEHDFYRNRLEKKHGLEVLVPPERDRATAHRIIDDELGFGKLLDASRAEYLRIISDLAGRGAEGVILGCTEISLLVGQNDTAVPLFDTTAIHAEAIAQYALGGFNE